MEPERERWSEARKAALFRQKGWWRDETLSDWLATQVSRRPDAAALIARQYRVTYRELAGQAARLASALCELGVEPGDIVAVQLPNIAEFVVAWLAIAACGAILQTMHMPYGPAETEPLLRHSGATTAIALGEMKGRAPAAQILGLAATLPRLRRFIAVGTAAPGTVAFGGLLGNPPAGATALPRVHATDAYLQLYTSGTTTAPKGVRVTYNHCLSNARMCSAELGITAEDRLLCAAPFTHLFGLYGLELGLSVGAAACLLPTFTPLDFATACRELRPTHVFAGPAHIAACFQQQVLDQDDLASLRIVVLSGSTVPPELAAMLEARLSGDGRVLQAWGMTELQFGACNRPDADRSVRFGTIGIATPGTEIRIAGEDGAVLSADEAGELEIRGCSVFSGYVGIDPASSADFTPDGWFRTGDLATMDAEGHVRLVGRLKDLINRGGIKINPLDIEIALAAHPAVAQVAVAPIPDAIFGERACCFVVLRPGERLDFEGLLWFLAERRIAKMRWPERLDVIEEMPMTPTRKIMKHELVRRLLARRADDDRRRH